MGCVKAHILPERKSTGLKRTAMNVDETCVLEGIERPASGILVWVGLVSEHINAQMRRAATSSQFRIAVGWSTLNLCDVVTMETSY